MEVQNNRARLVPSEKCAGGRGSDDDDMRMIPTSFVRAIERLAGDLGLHFLPRFQQVVAIRKTCNQLHGSVACAGPVVWLLAQRVWLRTVRDCRVYFVVC